MEGLECGVEDERGWVAYGGCSNLRGVGLGDLRSGHVKLHSTLHEYNTDYQYNVY